MKRDESRTNLKKQLLMDYEKALAACRISPIELPQELEEPVKDLMKMSHEEIKSNKNYIESGSIPLRLQKPLSIYFIIWALFNDVNEIIENINLILSDLKIMRDDPGSFSKEPFGDVRVRYKLLVRTFFYEFYRFQTCFSKYLAHFRKERILERKQVEKVIREFSEFFDDVIKVRGEMVHSRYHWSGEKHLKLNLASFAESTGSIILDSKTLKKLEKTIMLSEVVDDAIKVFVFEGIRARYILSDSIQNAAQLTSHIFQNVSQQT